MRFPDEQPPWLSKGIVFTLFWTVVVVIIYPSIETISIGLAMTIVLLLME